MKFLLIILIAVASYSLLFPNKEQSNTQISLEQNKELALMVSKTKGTPFEPIFNKKIAEQIGDGNTITNKEFTKLKDSFNSWQSMVIVGKQDQFIKDQVIQNTHNQRETDLIGVIADAVPYISGIGIMLGLIFMLYLREKHRVL